MEAEEAPLGHQFVKVARSTYDLLAARNKRDVGRGVAPPREHGDGTVSLLLSDEVIKRLEAQMKPPETLEGAIVRILWTAPRET